MLSLALSLCTMGASHILILLCRVLSSFHYKVYQKDKASLNHEHLLQRFTGKHYEITLNGRRRNRTTMAVMQCGVFAST
jgi:hypothetical protein